MNYTSYVAVKFYTELLLVVALYVFPFPKQRHFALRLVLCLIVGYGFSYITSPIFLKSYAWEIAARTTVNIFRYIGIFFCIVLSVWVCFDMKIRTAVFICAGSYAIQHLVLKLQGIVENLYRDRVPFSAVVGLYILFLLGCYALFYVCVIRRLHKRDAARLKANETFRFNLLMIISLIILSVFGFDMTYDRKIQELSFVGYGVICSVFLLCMQDDIFSKNALKEENEQVEWLLAQERKQFEMFRAGVEYLDIKCHDLKHQIHMLKQQPSVSAEAVAELESSIAAYESYGRTGCPALDIIIGEKYLQCANNGIEFISFVNSEKLNRLGNSDIYSLFGNAIDNAIEYELTLPKEKRFIRLSVKDIEHMLFIRIENYYEGAPISDGTTLHTTKADKHYHGFGLKSMRHICKRYGGEMEIEAHDGVFCLTFEFTMA